MKETDYGYKNPLRCPKCDDYRFLDFKGVRFPEGNKCVGINIPFLDCKNCDTSTPVVLFPKRIIDDIKQAEIYYKKIAKEQLDKLSDGEFIGLTKSTENKVFESLNTVGFKYDSRDYYSIPGLYMQWDEGYLTPIFFSKELLLYYNAHPEYKVKFASTTRFHIYNKKDEALISHGFGINRNGKIICWLGDLEAELQGDENYVHRNLFLTFNIDSDHDIISDYYFNQIEANWTSSDNETGIFYHRNEFDKKIKNLFGFELTQLDINKLIDEYKHPVINESHQIETSYIKLNSLLTESLNVSELKKSLIANGIDSKSIKGLKGLKLFEKFVEHNLKFENSSEIVSLLFILYDLRSLAGHIKDRKYVEKFNSCKERLHLKDNVAELDIHQVVCKRIKEMYEDLNKN
ncbi:MAG: hypothetical protein ACOCWG_03705 [bacterium]